MNIPQAHLVHPSLVVDSRNRLVPAVQSSTVVAVCMKRLGDEVLGPDSYMERLSTETWATLIRAQGNVYFITVAGLVPTDETLEDVVPQHRSPTYQETIHMAIEIGLAAWPEWGGELRDRFKPKAPISVHLLGARLEA